MYRTSQPSFAFRALIGHSYMCKHQCRWDSEALISSVSHVLVARRSVRELAFSLDFSEQFVRF